MDIDAAVDRIVTNSRLAEKADAMAARKGLTGAEAGRYTSGLMGAVRTRLRADLAAAQQEGRQQARDDFQAVLDHPAAQGQYARAVKLAGDPNLDREAAIAELKKGCGDADLLARSILNAGSE